MKNHLKLLPLALVLGCSTSPEKIRETNPFSTIKELPAFSLSPAQNPPAGHILLFTKYENDVFIKKCTAPAFSEKKQDCLSSAEIAPARIPAELFAEHIVSSYSLRTFPFDVKKTDPTYSAGIARQDKKISLAEMAREKQLALEFLKYYCQAMAKTNCDKERPTVASFRRSVTSLAWNKQGTKKVFTANELLVELVNDLLNKAATGYFILGTEDGTLSNILSSYLKLPSNDMKFVKIQPGKFMMGSPETDQERWGDEEKQVEVVITKKYEIQQNEVTQQQWFNVMGTNPSFFSDKKYCTDNFKVESGVALCPNLPVESVSWNDLQVFTKKLNALDKAYSYRLPTEAEWEYAARAGSATIFPFGPTPNDLEHYAWFSKNSHQQTQVVATKKPNAWGLYDTQGNVWEWTHDNYESRSVSQATDPMGPASGTHRVDKGGSWFFGTRGLRSASRCVTLPSSRARDLGFRLVRLKN